VLPGVPLASNSRPIDIPVNVSVKVIVIVDVYVAVLPIAVTPVVGPYASYDESSSKGQPHSGVVSRIGVRIIGIGGRSRSVNHLWVV
jgi:hypothetical protein